MQNIKAATILYEPTRGKSVRADVCTYVAWPETCFKVIRRARAQSWQHASGCSGDSGNCYRPASRPIAVLPWSLRHLATARFVTGSNGAQCQLCSSLAVLCKQAPGDGPIPHPRNTTHCLIPNLSRIESLIKDSAVIGPQINLFSDTNTQFTKLITEQLTVTDYTYGCGAFFFLAALFFWRRFLLCLIKILCQQDGCCTVNSGTYWPKFQWSVVRPLSGWWNQSALLKRRQCLPDCTVKRLRRQPYSSFLETSNLG